MKARNLYWPRTIIDDFQLAEWIALGLSRPEIEKRMASETWRSALFEIGKQSYCDQCCRPVAHDYCVSCGTPAY